MKKCFVCNAESPDSAIICLGCGNMVDPPIVEEVVEEVKPIPKEAFVKPKASAEALEAQDVASEHLRDEFRVFTMTQHFSGQSYGRLEYLKGIFKTIGTAFLFGVPAAAFIESGSDLGAVIGGVSMVLVICWAGLMQIVLMFGRLEDIGVTGLGWKIATLVGTWIPFAGTVIGLSLLFVPRNALKNI